MRTRRPWFSSISEIARARVVVGAASLRQLQEAGVDLVDDLHVPRQQPLEQRHRPALQRFRQQRVVGVGDRVRGDLPRRPPRHAVQVDQNAHQLRHGDRGMRVVELDRTLSARSAPCRTAPRAGARGPAARPRRRNIPAAAAVPVRPASIPRVEHARDRLGAGALRQRADVVAAVEVVEPDRIGRLRAPQAERVDAVAAPAGDRRVVGDRHHFFLRLPDVTAPCRPAPAPRSPCRRSRCDRPLRAARIPTGCRARASPPASRPASRP